MLNLGKQYVLGPAVGIIKEGQLSLYTSQLMEAIYGPTSALQQQGAVLLRQTLLVPIAETAYAEPQLCSLHTLYFVPESPTAVGLQLWKLGRTWPANVSERSMFI